MMKELYKDFISGNELLAVFSLIEAVTTRPISDRGRKAEDIYRRQQGCDRRGSKDP